jgi:hypothetical protein
MVDPIRSGSYYYIMRHEDAGPTDGISTHRKRWGTEALYFMLKGK